MHTWILFTLPYFALLFIHLSYEYITSFAYPFLFEFLVIFIFFLLVIQIEWTVKSRISI